MSRGSFSAAGSADLTPLEFADLRRWEADDHAAAFAAFLRSARRMVDDPPTTGYLGISGPDLQRVARIALSHDQTPIAAKRFFETYFQPLAVRPHQGEAFLTGYFEPEVEGSLVPTDRFQFPLFARPRDLVDIDEGNRPAGFDASYQFARQAATGLVPYFDRGEIEEGALSGHGIELVYLDDPIDVFFIHVQGSASIRLRDGRRMRVAYAAKTGHPYTSIGKRLIERGLATPETMTLSHLRSWLAANRLQATALMRENRSFVFFREMPTQSLEPDLGAIAAAGVQITPGRSLAVDRRLHTYGTPIWFEASLPIRPDAATDEVARLMIAQDTGSAIVGAARGDMFIGLGGEAGEIAGRIRHIPRSFVVLKPR